MWELERIAPVAIGVLLFIIAGFLAYNMLQKPKTLGEQIAEKVNNTPI